MSNEMIPATRRVAFKMHLNPGMKEEYRKRHDAIWPELTALLKEVGVSEYSIFIDDETDTLFAFHKLSGETGAQDLGETEIVQKWWAYMADIMETNPDNSPVSIPLEEMFYLE
jgi:L-rhamnose mutarotase